MSNEIELKCAVTDKDKLIICANGPTVGGVDITAMDRDGFTHTIILDYQSAKKLQAFINQNTRKGGRQR